MAGDDTPALQAVLSADAWREHLLAEERRLNAQIGSADGKPAESENDEEAAGLQDQLKEAYAKLQEIESDKAESRYERICLLRSYLFLFFPYLPRKYGVRRRS